MTKVGNRIALLVLASSIALSACGTRTEDTDGGTDGAPVLGPDGLPIDGNPDLGAVGGDLAIAVNTDVSALTTGGTDKAVIKATVIDADNRAVAGEALSFSATGGILQDISDVTDEQGSGQATLSLTGDLRNETILVTVGAGQFSSSVEVDASGTELDVTGDDSVVLGKSAEIVALLKAGNGEPIANQRIMLSSAVGNTIDPAEPVTDSDGRIQVSVGSANGSDTISISSLEGTVTELFQFTVANDQLDFSVTGEVAEIPVGSVADIDVVWTNQGQPVANGDLQVSTTAGQLLSAPVMRTNVAGQATLTITSSSAGPARVTVSAADDGTPTDYVSVEFVATTPATVDVDSSVSRVGIEGTSEITALVTDANGNPVKGQEVVFSSIDLRGGVLNPASDTTNSAGEAKIQFKAGKNATETDAIRISAEVEDSGISGDTLLTIFKPAINVTLGTANKVVINDTSTQYHLDFTVQVADGSGRPLEGANVELSVEPLRYYKGQMLVVDKSGQLFVGATGQEADHWARFADPCIAEDLDRDDILDPGEDTNQNMTLDPQDPSSLAASTDPTVATLQGGGYLETDATGSGYFRLIYPASSALWADVEITASAQGLGDEATTDFETSLKVPASEVNNPDVSPANQRSPYGLQPDCSVED